MGRVWRSIGVVGTGATVLLLGGCDLGDQATPYVVQGRLAGAADVDGDGHLDLVTSGSASAPGTFTVLRGDGSGAFTTTTVDQMPLCESFELTTCSPGTVLDVADVDGDGLADVLVQSTSAHDGPDGRRSEYRLDVRLADGTGGFGAPTALIHLTNPTTTDPPNTVWRLDDATGDGEPDLVGFDNMLGLVDTLHVRPGDGAGHFGADVVTTLSSCYMSTSESGADDITFADVNGDAAPDVVTGGLALGGSGEDFVRGCAIVALGNGTGAFTATTRYLAADNTVDGIVAVRVADLDEDGHPDLIGANVGSDIDGGRFVGSLSAFYGDGTGTFGPEVSLPAATQTTGLQTGDFDGDGHLDLLTATYNPVEPGTRNWGHVMFGDGSGGFPDEHLLLSGVGRVVDLDMDGKPDFVRSSDAGTVEVYLNRWDGRPD
jgi:hypothetical protein